MNKYRAKKTECRQQHIHDSKKEARRCDDLHLLQKAGQIHSLEVHRRYPIKINGEPLRYVNSNRPVVYEGDFSYFETAEDGGSRRVVEDVKSRPTRTPAYKIKQALMKHCYGIEIRET